MRWAALLKIHCEHTQRNKPGQKRRAGPRAEPGVGIQDTPARATRGADAIAPDATRGLVGPLSTVKKVKARQPTKSMHELLDERARIYSHFCKSRRRTVQGLGHRPEAAIPRLGEESYRPAQGDEYEGPEAA